MYNGNIRKMATAIRDINEVPLELQATVYKYDQLNRFKEMNAYHGSDYASAIDDGSYHTEVSFDGNGNILTLERNGALNAGGLAMDNFTYQYNHITPGQPQLYNNKLRHVDDQVSVSAYADDIDQQQADNYNYDALGQLVGDEAEGIKSITWNVMKKVVKIERYNDADPNPSSAPDIEFLYGANGNRLGKITKPRDNGVLKSQEHWTYTWYSCDATGNVLAVYDRNISPKSGVANGWVDQIRLDEVHLYGSSRVGILPLEQIAAQQEYVVTGTNADGSFIIDINTSQVVNVSDEPSEEHERRARRYELSNHLGNVLATITDRKVVVANPLPFTTVAFYHADVVSYSDYYPYGMTMAGRNVSSGAYRYGFNGMEKDDEWQGAYNSYNFGARIQDPRVGRFLSSSPWI